MTMTCVVVVVDVGNRISRQGGRTGTLAEHTVPEEAVISRYSELPRSFGMPVIAFTTTIILKIIGCSSVET
jgi:hypothetical protein